MPGLTKSPPSSRKRKLDDEAAIEIDLSAPEPPSKKALRKAKKKAIDQPSQSPAPAKPKDDSQPTESQPTATPKRTGFGVWVGNLAFSTTRDDLRTFLTTRGALSKDEITRIHLPDDPSRRKGTHRNRGFAYIDFISKEVEQKVIGLSEQELNGRKVLIKSASSFEGRPESKQAESGKKAGNPPAKKIFVGNLAFDATKEMLEEHFGRCGVVNGVHVATFEDSGKCKGYAWVEFDDIESAEAAVRGWLKVADEESEEESSENSDEEEAEDKPTKKPKLKKVWVNRLMGRPLRMEFAEDSTTRYQKRFGKDAKKPDGGQADGEVHPIEEISQKDTKSKHRSTDRSSGRKTSKPVQSHSRYSEDTVHRLSGSIVPAQGKKVTFD
jgi:RNA recognition motif-containing protein